MTKPILMNVYHGIMDYNVFGRVKSSRHRTKIIELLSKSPKTPKELAEQTGLNISNLSNYLSSLEGMGLIICLNDKLRKGRIYALTDVGKEVYHHLKE